MIQKLYVIYDKTAEEAGPIQCAKNDGIAVRIFKQSLLEVTFPEDYRLFLVGSYDTEKVEFVMLDEPSDIIDASGEVEV